jgi:hypothetical protein
MCYPKVKWLNSAKMLLKGRLTDNASFTSLDFKQDLRDALPEQDVRQTQVGEFLREAYKEGLMPGFVSVVEGNHLRYTPIKKTLWQRIISLFR